MKLAIIGGHLSPALAVIEALPKEVKVLFIGRKHAFEGDAAYSLEYNVIKSLKIPFASISAGRLQRRFTGYTIPSLLKIPYGFVQAFCILHKFKPDVVLGFGGYLSMPVILSAYILRIPIVIHEQTLEAGLSNKIASLFANKICISWKTSKNYFPARKTVLTGNPIRKELLNLPSKFSIFNFKFSIKDKKLPLIYITGGSSGSHFINRAIEGCINQLLERFIVIHQTGDAQEYHDFGRLQSLKDTLPQKIKERYILKKFIDPKDVGLILEKAAFVVSRSGINTITELIYLEKPALLIPHPYSQNNEQLKNALFFKSLGLGEVLEQESLGSNKFLQKVEEMINNINKYRRHYDKRDFGKIGMTSFENPAKKIVEVVKYVAK